MEPQSLVTVFDGAAESELEPPVEALGVYLRCLRHENGEETVPEVSGDVGSAQGAENALPGRRIVVHAPLGLEKEKPERAVVAPGSSALAPQALVEVAPVVEAGERVGVGEPPRLGIEPCVFEGWAAGGGDLLEAGELRFVHGTVPAAPEHRECADALPVLAGQRHGEPSGKPECVVHDLVGRIDVAQPHGPGSACFRRDAEQVAHRLLSRQAVPGGDVAVLVAENDERGVRLGQVADCAERTLERFVEIERPTDRSERGQAAACSLVSPRARLRSPSSFSVRAPVAEIWAISCAASRRQRVNKKIPSASSSAATASAPTPIQVAPSSRTTFSPSPVAARERALIGG
jgi:hypothetical protein